MVMRNFLGSVFLAFVCVLGLVGIPQPAQASLSAANAFSSLTGSSVTFDSGGSVHSQARSIYSMGGGMATFQGKKVTLLAVDPPSFSAGCAGISWHFGGFAFISMDELRQLVEAISQASLGIAVDLAMQTLCPQCYAVMNKLREIANAMRNAAADSCRIAQQMGRAVGNFLGLSESKQSTCSEGTAARGQSEGWLNSAAGTLCRSMNAVNNFLDEQGTKLVNWLNGSGGAEKTPDRAYAGKHFNVQYEILSALGYQDGVIKDLMLNYTGMTIYYPKPTPDCTAAFGSLTATAVPPGAPTGAADMVSGRSEGNSVNDSTQVPGKTTPSNPEASGTQKSIHTCHAAPRLEGVPAIAQKIVCGFNPYGDMERFASQFSVPGGVAGLSETSMYKLCLGSSASPGAVALGRNASNPKLYTCDAKAHNRCLNPGEKYYSELVGDSPGQYTGLAWMIAAALMDGAVKVANNHDLPETTKTILSNSGYPLYRLINLAAVYPGMASDLLLTYSANIAIQYAVDTLDKLARPGYLSTTEMSGRLADIPHQDILELRNSIASMVRDGEVYKDRTMKMMSEKRALVQSIIEINRALQADVISQGMAGNAALALSIKNQVNGSGRE